VEHAPANNRLDIISQNMAFLSVGISIKIIRLLNFISQYKSPFADAQGKPSLRIPKFMSEP
jgi:hypothetical protein